MFRVRMKIYLAYAILAKPAKSFRRNLQEHRFHIDNAH